MTAAESGLSLFLYRDCVFRVPDGVPPPKAGSFLFCRALAFRPGERVLEIWAGMGLAAVLAARAGAQVIATDIVPECVRSARANAALNGVEDRVDVRHGDAYEPVAGLAFDLICSSPPQMPTPASRERGDAAAAADNGGRDGWALLDRLIAGAPLHLHPGGRLVFTLFAFLGVKRAHAALEAAHLEPSVLARERQPFPRLGYERIEYIRSLDAEGAVPIDRWPTHVERLVLQGRRA
jgi:release factor glutamine methyltransferase